MEDFLAALGLVLVLEGVLYALFPEGMQRMMAAALTISPAMLRGGGLVAAAAGFGIVWLVRG
jgi:uncharacterized protein YjeT (DUF2065 family)